jgi:hypothetical protein
MTDKQPLDARAHCGDGDGALSEASGETTIRRQLEYLRMAMRESLGLPADAPDEDIIDTAAERWRTRA